MEFLRRLWGRGFTASLAPDTPLCVIGDVHGRADLLQQLLEVTEPECSVNTKLVFLGDMIDRGEKSAETLDLIQSLKQKSSIGSVTALKGNHEAMLLDFIDAPEETGALWLANGGNFTLHSYGIRPPKPEPAALSAARDDLCRAMGRDMIAWLRNLPLFEMCGNIFISHAGADPHAGLDQQSDADLIWGHPEFLTKTRRDGVWVAHGHYIVETAVAQNGRISIDTGAYATQKLSAALIDLSCFFRLTDWWSICT
jgi:serine/threonine protein phosphatase 1